MSAHRPALAAVGAGARVLRGASPALSQRTTPIPARREPSATGAPS